MSTSKKSARPNKIFCGIPLYGGLSPLWVQHWILFSAQLGKHHARVHVVSMPYVDVAENSMVDDALACKCGHVFTAHRLDDSWGCRGFIEKDGVVQSCPCQQIDYVEQFDYLCMVEHDNIIPDGWLDLVEAYDLKNVAVAGLPYFGKVANDQRPIPGYLRNGRGKAKPKGFFDRVSEAQLKEMGIGREADPKKRGLYPIDVVGMGATAIRRDVFVNWDRKRLPWFQVKHVAPSGFRGQDVSFCMEAKRQGYDVLLDTRLSAGHVGPWVSTEETFGASMWWQRERAKGAA